MFSNMMLYYGINMFDNMYERYPTEAIKNAFKNIDNLIKEQE